MVKVNFDESQYRLYKISAKVAEWFRQGCGMVFVQPFDKPQ
jgi:hypothetical protein